MTSSRVVVPYALVLAVPAIAWLGWVSWSAGQWGSAGNVLWFATVALGVVAAGLVGPRSTVHYVAMTAAASVSALVTVVLWWSAEDLTGLFTIGLAIAAPLVVVSVGVCLLLGRTLSSPAVRSDAAGIRNHTKSTTVRDDS